MKKAPREMTTRPPIGRIKRIDEWIRGGKYPNAVTMGRHLEVAERTVKRGIEYMRNGVWAPMGYDDVRHGYFYSKPYDFLPVTAVTEAEMFALLIADKAIAQYRGMPFQKPLRMAFKKLTGQLDSAEQYSLENLGLALSFRPFAPE